MSKPFCVGIDLGTSNSALAVIRDPESDAEATVLDISQIAGPGKIVESKVLPSAIYLPHDGELSPGQRNLPWDTADLPDAIVGQWARERGAEVPERLIASAKSWLCHDQVDRKGPILPWQSTIADRKYSPVESSRYFLDHLRRAFEAEMKKSGESRLLSDCKVVLTVPASFDEVARTLTYEAAEAAGLGRVTLLEEPQAAFYSWIAQSDGNWRDQVKPGDLVLVIDIGGGTTDFSLISVHEDGGNLRLERISVGEHLLLGGDNMDLALAYQAKRQLETDGHVVDHWQMLSLVHSARLAKEKLLFDSSTKEIPLAIASRGSSLFAKAATTRLTRKAVVELTLEGFFPLTAITEMPVKQRALGLQETGLPFVADAAISKHLARFLSRSLENVRSDKHLSSLVGKNTKLAKTTFLQPTAVLFNGGVFNSPAIKERVLELLESWNQGEPLKELKGSHLDLAVAKGAATYAKTMVSEKGVRIKAGTARSYYLGVLPTTPAVPGYEPPIKGLCVVPQGVEEGSELHLEGQTFGLVTGEPVEFRFFNSSVRAGDGMGTVVDDAKRDLQESSHLKVTLPSSEGGRKEIVPVQLDAVVTEVGTLELWMKHTQSDRKWNLEFNVRPNE